jgi:hypothetical protein
VDQIPHGLFRRDARMARRAHAQVFVHLQAVRVRQLVVNVWSDEGVDGLAVKH